MYRRAKRKKRIISTLLVMSGAVAALAMAGWKGVATADTLRGDELIADAAYGQAKCTVRQKLIAKNPDVEEAEFSYKITAVEGAPLPGGVSEFTLRKDETRELNFTFTAEGSYIYRLTCTGYDDGNFREDTTEYTIKAFVYREGGKTETELIIVEPGGEKKAEATFKHVKLNEMDEPEVDPIIAVDPPVKKRITGTPAKTDEFKFRLRAEETGNPMPEGSAGGEKVMSVFGEGVEEFGTWAYQVPGTYNYDISEVNMGNPDYKYDTKMFTITDVVTLNDGELKVDRTIVDSNGNKVASTLITQDSPGEKPLSVEFTNEYTGGKGPTESQNPTESQSTTGGGENPTGDTTTGGNPGGSESGGDTKGGSSSKRASRPNTGDRNNMIIFIVLGAAAAGIILIVLVAKRRKKEEK